VTKFLLDWTNFTQFHTIRRRMCVWMRLVTTSDSNRYSYHIGTAIAQCLRCCATNRKVAVSIPTGVSGIFHWHKILPIALWPRNEYQEHFLGGKGGRWLRLTIVPPSCAVVMKSGNLNFLEPSGPLQACNGTALSLPYTYHIVLGGFSIWRIVCLSWLPVCVFTPRPWIHLFIRFLPYETNNNA